MKNLLIRLISGTTAAVCLILLTPLIAVLLVGMLLVHHESPIFQQTRVGKNGRCFQLYKIKSFYHGVPSRLGMMLRKTSLDELPQLVHIVTGDMAWVGPRPLIPSELDSYPEDAFRLYQQMTPGLTGLFQIRGRKNLSILERAQCDSEYFYTRGVITDITILLKTIPAVLSGSGAV